MATSLLLWRAADWLAGPAAGWIAAIIWMTLPSIALGSFVISTDTPLLLCWSAGVLALSAWMLRNGLRAEAAYNARKVARSPGMPRKLFSSILAGLGIAIAAYKAEPGLVAPVIFGAVTTGLHVFSFGVDPMKNKGMEGVDQFQTDRVARAVGEAEKLLAAMKGAILRARDRELERRVDSFQATARHMFRTIEDDPRDLTAARKYLTVYLMGARDATVKFADIYSQSRNSAARADYVRLLDDLETNFTARTQKMLTDDHADLNIEIDVLRERLAREGVVSS